MATYRHVTFEERCKIDALRKEGLSLEAIGKRLGRSASTISRELARNGDGRGYGPDRAQERAQRRRREASAVPRKLQGRLWDLIVEKLQLQWSPEQIAGWLSLKKIAAISFKWIYQRIWRDRAAGGHLYLHLRQQGRKRRTKPLPGTAGRGQIPGRVDISERPAEVEEKSSVGDFEVDTIIGSKHRGAFVTVVDRHSKFLFLKEVTRKTAAQVGKALVDPLEPVRDSVRTITADNGKEFAGHADFGARLGADVCFARPYHSWERGLNEHSNGLVRQYFGKGESLLEVDPGKLRLVAGLINDRPRNALGYCSPRQVFEAAALARAPRAA